MNDASRLPPDLQIAMRTRDEAFYGVDPVQWGKYTSEHFTTVQQNGNFYTRADRIENLKTQKQRPPVPREREEFLIQDDMVVTRFFSGGLWVVEVWKRVDGAWASVMSQATAASPAAL
jgi:hypothetical protein